MPINTEQPKGKTKMKNAKEARELTFKAKQKKIDTECKYLEEQIVEYANEGRWSIILNIQHAPHIEMLRKCGYGVIQIGNGSSEYRIRWFDETTELEKTK